MARIFFDSRDLAAAARRKLASFDRELSTGDPAGDFVPPMDVVDTDTGVEVLLDLPGVTVASLTITVRDGVLLVAGTKSPTRCQHRHAAFHLAERGFGRFARAVRLAGALDVRHATATFLAGELRIVLPRITDRRSEEIRITVEPAPTPTAEPGA